MKKISVLFAFLLVAAVTFVGCKKDEEEKAAPTIAFSGSDAGSGSKELDFSAADPQSLVFNVDVTAEGEISTFTITKKIYASSTTTSNPTASDYAGKTSYTYNFSQSFTSADFDVDGGVSKIEYTFDVTDKQDPAKSVSKTFTVTKKTVSANPINTFPNLTLVSAFLSATTGDQFVSALTGTTYRHDETGASASSFGFISGGGSGADFVCSGSTLSFSQKPSGWATGAKLATTTLTSAEFDAIANEDDLLAAIPSSITSDDITGLNTNYFAVLAFTVGGKKGLVKMPSSFTNANDQSIVISIKVQKL